MSTLTKKRQLFCKFYATPFSETYGNATQSALKAGFSTRTARTEGSHLLTMPAVQNECERIEHEQIKSCDWTIEKFRQELDKCYNAVDANSPQKSKYMEMIAKVKRFFEPDNQTNILIFNGSDAKTIAEQVKVVRERVRGSDGKTVIQASEHQKPLSLTDSLNTEPVAANDHETA